MLCTRYIISGCRRNPSSSLASWALIFSLTVFGFVIPTVFRQVAKFVHFILRISLLSSHPLLITPIAPAVWLFAFPVPRFPVSFCHAPTRSPHLPRRIARVCDVHDDLRQRPLGCRPDRAGLDGSFQRPPSWRQRDDVRRFGLSGVPLHCWNVGSLRARCADRAE